jgi:hypothetical protein
MANEYQIIYEYTDGNTISFKTNDLSIQYIRHKLQVTPTIDGTIVVTDPAITQRIFTFSAIISGNDMDTLDGVQMASITYSGAYPKIQKIYWDGASTEENVEVAITSLTTSDQGGGWWKVNITMAEKDQ